jgi:hypothetical protein
MMDKYISTKPNVLLDLDNTIICAVEKHNYNKEKFQLLDDNLYYKDFGKYYRIYERPGLQPFLDFLFEHFNVNVFTAASKDYGLFIINNFILRNHPDKKVQWMFHSYHTTISEAKYNSYKDLRLLYSTIPDVFTPENTFIIDDLKQVKKANKQNCINVKAFEVFNEGKKTIVQNAIKDNELSKIIDVVRLFL